MANPNVLNLELTDNDRDYLVEVTESFPTPLLRGREAEVANWIDNSLASNIQTLPTQLRELTQSFGLSVDAVHIAGLTHANLPPTPHVYETVDDATVYPFDLPHLALSALVGTIYGSSHVRGGRILADIFPKIDFETKRDSAFGSKQVFDFHADGVVQPDTAPDVFSLHCLKNEEQVSTFFSVVSAEDFEHDVYNALSEPVYTIVYEAGNEVDVLKGTPIIQEDSDGRLKLNYYGAAKILLNHSKTMDKRYENALQVFATVLQASAHSVILQPGDILFVDNKHSLHGRQAFNTKSVLADDRRWLRRLFITRDPTLIEQINQSKDRVLTSRYKQS
jgi:hypothetical protein